MPLVNHREKVNASAEKLWGMMLEKIRRPDKYVPGIVRVELLNDYNEFSVERRMETAHGKLIREIIFADTVTKTVIFKYVQDPMYSGFVTNTIFEEEDGVYLDYTLNWSLKSGQQDPQPESFWAETIKKAVLHAKAMAESQ
jgi:hypothetical protein